MPRLAAFPKAFMDQLCVTGTMTIRQWIELGATNDLDGPLLGVPLGALKHLPHAAERVVEGAWGQKGHALRLSVGVHLGSIRALINALSTYLERDADARRDG